LALPYPVSLTQLDPLFRPLNIDEPVQQRERLTPYRAANKTYLCAQTHHAARLHGLTKQAPSPDAPSPRGSAGATIPTPARWAHVRVRLRRVQIRRKGAR
ncbi:hypothetical protein LTR28_001962, partial [Elasticomyces elasticus]